MTRWFTLEEFRQLCFDLAASLDWVELEPIPDFDTRYPHRLESCLATPQQSFAGQFLYPTLVNQAAILFYLLIKSHPFVNGNKRIALIALVLFLLRNRKLLKATDEECYDLTMMVASSDGRKKNRVLLEIANFITERLEDVTDERVQKLIQVAESEEKK